MPKIRVNKVDIHYEEHGHGEPVALLNGIMQNTAGWAFQTPVLARRYRVILHDLRGQGLSDKPDGAYTWDDHVEDFRALLDALGVARTHLIGVSYGAEVAMHFALKYPERVAALVLGTAASELTPLLRAFAESWEVAAGCRDGRKFFKLFAPSVYGNAFYATHADWLEQRADLFAKVVTDEWFAAFERLLANFYTLDITARLPAIQVPTLVVAAEKDVVKPVELSALIARQIRQAELVVIADSGHAALLEKPAEFNTAILGFLAKYGLTAKH